LGLNTGLPVFTSIFWRQLFLWSVVVVVGVVVVVTY
jgi:hypothetical protein